MTTLRLMGYCPFTNYSTIFLLHCSSIRWLFLMLEICYITYVIVKRGGAMAKEIFSRYELKYLIDMETYWRLREEIMPYVRYDSHGPEGKYNIVSLYFETPERRIYYETRNKLRFRQKLRLRVYGGARLEDKAFFEIKQKYNRVVNKRRTSIVLQDAYDYIYQGKDPQLVRVSNSQIFREIQSFQSLYNLHPEIIVSYDRQAFNGLFEQDLRVTFDYNLRCRQDDLRVENGSEGQLFLDPNLVILEVKINNSVPFWLARVLSNLGCVKKSVSKYCTSMETISEGVKAYGFKLASSC